MTDIYGSSGEADTYHAARGNTDWAAASSGDKTQALIVASEWIDATYRAMFPGEKTGERAQEREWPRTDAYDDRGFTIDDDEVPTEVKHATYEVALRHIQSPGQLYTDGNIAENIQSVAVEGAVSLTYRGAATMADLQLVMPIVSRILAPVLTATGANSGGLFGRSYRI